MEQTLKLGNDPNGRYVTFRITKELHAELAEIASKDDRSVSYEIRKAISQYVHRRSA